MFDLECNAPSRLELLRIAAELARNARADLHNDALNKDQIHEIIQRTYLTTVEFTLGIACIPTQERWSDRRTRKAVLLWEHASNRTIDHSIDKGTKVIYSRALRSDKGQDGGQKARRAIIGACAYRLPVWVLANEATIENLLRYLLLKNEHDSGWIMDILRSPGRTVTIRNGEVTSL